MTQSVFLRALSSLNNFEDRGIPFEVYLFRIARNLLVDHWRTSSRRTTSLATLDDDSNLVALPSAWEDSFEDRHELSNAFTRLSADHQRILHLRLVDGRTSAEVAALVGSTPQAVRQMQVRAISALRAAIETSRRHPRPAIAERKDVTP